MAVRKPRLIEALTISVVAAVIAIPHAAAQAGTKSTRSGVYTKEQASRGQQQYEALCTACHADDLSGREQAPALTGPEFDAKWTKQPLSDLVTKMRSMPPSKPNSVPRPEIVDMTAYILSVNGLPAGEVALSEESSVLSTVIYEPIPANH